MSLIIDTVKGLCYPRIICDQCGEPIKDAKEGNYQWRMDLPSPQKIYFTHKGMCCFAFERRGPFEQPGEPLISWGAMELEVLPLFLETNLGIKHRKALETARVIAWSEDALLLRR